MENIIYFGGDSLDSQEDLPWLKDWVKSHNDVEAAKEVLTIYSGDKGLLCQTGEYKSFIFRKESTYGYLIEALELWVRNKLEVAPLIISPTRKGTSLYGLHQDKPKIRWIFDDGKYSSWRNDGTVSPIPKKTNPFLPSDNPAQTESKTEQSPQPKGKKTNLETPSVEPTASSTP